MRKITVEVEEKRFQSRLESLWLYPTNRIDNWANEVTRNERGVLINALPADDIYETERQEKEALDAFKKGEELPLYFFFFDKELVAKVVEMGVCRFGTKFLEYGVEDEDISEAVQLVLFGKAIH